MGLFNRRNENRPTFEVLGTDMHCHLLPSVDDGSRDINETLSCLKTMKSLGFKKIYFTPHFQANYPNDETDIVKRFEQLKKALAPHASEIPELAGISGEYRFDQRYERRAGIDAVNPLPGKKLLCELSLHGSNYNPLESFKAFLAEGYNLILAHPERYPYLGIHSPELKEILDLGIKLQLNTLSLNGFYGPAALEKGFAFLENGWVSYLGTDLHNTHYAQELVATAANSKVQKVLQRYKFLNSEL